MKKVLILIISIFTVVYLNGCNKEYGEFITLQKAFDEKLINDEDLKNIAYYLNGTTFDSFTPREKEPSEISASDIKKIKKTQLNIYMNSENSDGGKMYPNIKLDDINIKGYYGTYNGCIALRIENGLSNYPAVECVDTVDGISFHYSGAPVVIFKFS